MRLFAVVAAILFVSNAYAGDVSKCEGNDLQRIIEMTASGPSVDLKNDKDELVGRIELLEKSTEMSNIHLCGANGTSFYAKGDVSDLAGSEISAVGFSVYNDETDINGVATTLEIKYSSTKVALYIEHRSSIEGGEPDYADFKTTIYAEIPKAAKK